jgi:hypothetical protein
MLVDHEKDWIPLLSKYGIEPDNALPPPLPADISFGFTSDAGNYSTEDGRESRDLVVWRGNRELYRSPGRVGSQFEVLGSFTEDGMLHIVTRFLGYQETYVLVDRVDLR